MFITIAIILAAVLIYIWKGFIIVNKNEAVIIEHLGKYSKTLNAGLHFIVPFLEAPKSIITLNMVYSNRIYLGETVYNFPKQNFTTNDNKTISINALLFIQIIDAKKLIYSIENLPNAIEKITQANLENIAGQMALDETLVSRDIINEKLRDILDKTTDKWGVKVNRVELQDIVTEKI